MRCRMGSIFYDGLCRKVGRLSGLVSNPTNVGILSCGDCTALCVQRRKSLGKRYFRPLPKSKGFIVELEAGVQFAKR